MSSIGFFFSHSISGLTVDDVQNGVSKELQVELLQLAAAYFLSRQKKRMRRRRKKPYKHRRIQYQTLDVARAHFVIIKRRCRRRLSFFTYSERRGDERMRELRANRTISIIVTNVRLPVEIAPACFRLRPSLPLLPIHSRWPTLTTFAQIERKKQRSRRNSKSAHLFPSERPVANDDNDFTMMTATTSNTHKK